MTSAAYDDIAAWYDSTVRAGTNAFAVEPLLRIIGDVRGQLVCDLATGQGIVARRLAERGARVVGVDVSSKMLEIARRMEREEPRGIAYVQGDAQGRLPVRASAFDGVACNVALADIADLPTTLADAARALRPGGWFAFSVTRPCFQTPDSDWQVDDDGRPSRRVRAYFREGFWRSDNPEGVRGRVGAHHRTLSTYVNALADAGLVIERLDEPRPTGALAARAPGYDEVPTLLVARCRRVEAVSLA